MAATLLYVTSLTLSDVIFAPHLSEKLIPVQFELLQQLCFGSPAL